MKVRLSGQNAHLRSAFWWWIKEACWKPYWKPEHSWVSFPNENAAASFVFFSALLLDVCHIAWFSLQASSLGTRSYVFHVSIAPGNRCGGEHFLYVKIGRCRKLLICWHVKWNRHVKWRMILMDQADNKDDLTLVICEHADSFCLG